MEKRIWITNKNIGEKIKFEGIKFPVKVIENSMKAKSLSLEEGIAYFVNPSKKIENMEDAYNFGHIFRDVCLLKKGLAITRPETYNTLSTKGYSEVDKFHSFEKFDKIFGDES